MWKQWHLKFQNIWRLSDILWNNTWLKILKENKKYFELNENEKVLEKDTSDGYIKVKGLYANEPLKW